MAEVKELILELALNNQKLINGLKQTDAAFEKTKESQTKLQKGIGGLKTAYAAAAGIIGGVVIASLTRFIKKAAEFEQVRTAFETFLGSAQKAKIVLRDLEKFAIVTPYTNDQVFKASKTLLAFGTTAKDLMPTLKLIGDVSAGTGKDLSEMAVIFGQIKSTGRLMGQDLLQLINAGFNPLQVISEKTGRSMADLKSDMEKGLISFDMVEGAFKSATSAGGLFFGMMDKQSKTLSGRLSTLQGNMDILERTIGEQLSPIVGQWVDFTNSIIGSDENMKIFKKTASGVVGVIRLIGQNAFNTFRAMLAPIELGIRAFFTFKDTIDKIAKGDIKNLQGAFSNTFGKIKNEMVDVGKSIIDGYKTPLTDFIASIKAVDEVVEGTSADIADKQTGAIKQISEAEKEATEKRIADAKRLKEEKIKLEKETTEKQLELIQNVISTAQQLESGISETFSMFSQNRAQEYDNEMIRRTNALQAQLDQGLISEEQFADEKKKIDKDIALKKAKDERDLAGVMKALKITEIALSTASGIASAFAPYIPILSEIRAGIVAGVGVAQTAAVAAAPLPEIPTFAKGGVIEDVMSAPIRGEDGIIGVQRGESVLNRQATAILGADAIDALNAGRSGGNSVVINVNSNNGREVVEVLNDYFRQYGTSNRGQAT